MFLSFLIPQFDFDSDPDSDLNSACRGEASLRKREQVGPEIGAFVTQAEFDPQVFSVEINGGFSDIQNIGDLLTGSAILDQGGNLHFLGRQYQAGIGQPLQ